MKRLCTALLFMCGLMTVAAPGSAYDFQGPTDAIIAKYNQYRRAFEEAAENERSFARYGLGLDMRIVLAPSPQFTWYADYGDSSALRYGLLIGVEGVSAFSRDGRIAAAEELWFGDLDLDDRSRIPAFGYFLTHGRVGPVQPFNLPARIRFGVLTGFHYWVALDNSENQFLDPDFLFDHPYFLEDSGGSFLYPHAEITVDVLGVPWTQSIATNEYSSSFRFSARNTLFQFGVLRRYRPLSDTHRYSSDIRVQIDRNPNLLSFFVFQESGFTRQELELRNESLLHDFLFGFSAEFRDRTRVLNAWAQPVGFTWLQWGFSLHAIIDETRFELAWNDRDFGRTGFPTGGITLAATTLF